MAPGKRAESCMPTLSRRHGTPKTRRILHAHAVARAWHPECHQFTAAWFCEFEPANSANWAANGISYGPYRDGQRPGGSEPTKRQIAADLDLLVDDGW